MKISRCFILGSVALILTVALIVSQQRVSLPEVASEVVLNSIEREAPEALEDETQHEISVETPPVEEAELVEMFVDQTEVSSDHVVMEQTVTSIDVEAETVHEIERLAFLDTDEMYQFAMFVQAGRNVGLDMSEFIVQREKQLEVNMQNIAIELNLESEWAKTASQ